MLPLNLASRPFRNPRLPALLLGVASVALLLVTVEHGLVLKRLLSAKASAFEQEVSQLERESEQLRARSRELQGVQTDRASLARWLLVKDIVDRRVFSWTELLTRLSAVLPPGVRLTSIAPQVKGGRVRLELVAQVQSADEGLGFVRALEQRPEFADVYPLSASQREGGAEFRYSMNYLAPEGRPADSGKAAATPDAAAEDDASDQGEVAEEQQ